MPSVYPQQYIVVNAFHTVFHAHEMIFGQFRKKIEHLPIHAIRARTYDDTAYPGTGEHPRIERLYRLKIPVRIGISLKIGHKTGRTRIAFAQESESFFDLYIDVFMMGIERDERLVVAESAAACPHTSVPVGARKARRKGQFLHTPSEALLQPFGGTVIGQIVSPGICSAVIHRSLSRSPAERRGYFFMFGSCRPYPFFASAFFSIILTTSDNTAKPQNTSIGRV